MRRRKKISIAIIVVIIIGIVAVVAGTMFMPTNNELSTGEKHIYVHWMKVKLVKEWGAVIWHLL